MSDSRKQYKMGVHYEWADDRQMIMNIALEHPWTWAEFNQVMAELMPMLRDLKRPCAITVDCSQIGALPRDGNFLNILMNIEKNMPPNAFASAIIAAPYGVSVFINMIMKIRPNPKMLTVFTPTMADAQQTIYARYEEKFPNLGEAKRTKS